MLKAKQKHFNFASFVRNIFFGSKRKYSIYTNLTDASKEIKKRWDDVKLKRKVEEYLGGDIPEFLNQKPCLVLFRNIATPNNEVSIMIDFAIKSGLDFIVLEFTKDRFVAFNKDKQLLVAPSIYMGKSNHGKDRIYKMQVTDVNESQGKTFNEIKTIWGESLVDFHHMILKQRYPETTGKVFEFSGWLENHGGRAKEYYKQFIALFIRNCVLVECFGSAKDEVVFFNSIFKPSFDIVKKEFDLKPLIVELSTHDSLTNQIWWYYRDSIKDLIDGHIHRNENGN